jgi:hypothetical protein
MREGSMMAKQTVYLFVKALIIGLLLNLGIQYVSTVSLAQQETTILQEEQRTLTQSPINDQITFQNK